jgi:hypothetical protein
MSIELEKFKIVSDTMAKPEPGYFAIDRPTIEWINCRERFIKLLNASRSDGFFFSHNRNDAEQVIRFIWKTEQILETNRSVFGKTNRPYAMWIDLSRFWRENYTKISLLLILLRSGLSYDPSKDNYEQALYSEKYLTATKPAIMRFLFGFTHCIQGTSGWLTTFKNMTVGEIKKNLIYPPECSVDYSIIGANTLWG